MTSHRQLPPVARFTAVCALLLCAITVAPYHGHAGPPPPAAERTSDGGLQKFPQMQPLPTVPATYAGFVSGSFSVGAMGHPPERQVRHMTMPRYVTRAVSRLTLPALEMD